MGPSGRFYSCKYLVMLMIGTCGSWVELPVQGRLCPIFRESCRVTRSSRVFRGLTGSQRTPRVLGVTDWYQSLGIRIPWELGGCRA